MADNVHTSCPLCPCVNERSQDDHSVYGGQDTDFRPFRFDSNGIPVNWTQVRRLQQEQYILEELKPGLPEYDKIVAEFSRMKIRVTRIERLQNMGLLERFKAEEENVKKDRGNDSNLNICYLYHGTCLEKKHICENGLDQSSSTKGNKGQGLYFSNDPGKCMHYSTQRNRPDETIILKSRVILDGEQNLSTSSVFPTQSGSTSGSIVTKVSPEDLTEYVVHEHRRVMVEYLIFFEVDNEQLADGERWRPLVMFIVLCSVGYIIAPYLIMMVLWALGFTAQGVTKGSIAAKWQSFIGVTRGSWFATAQSTAATGFVNEWTRIIIGLFIGTIYSAVTSVVSMD